MNTKIEPDPIEDAPFPDGVAMTDWTGMAWREIPPERVEYIITHKTKRGKIVEFLSQIPVGEGRKRENLPNFKTANAIRNALYRAARTAWGTKLDNGKIPTNIKVMVSHDEATNTYTVEFVHLAAEKKKGL